MKIFRSTEARVVQLTSQRAKKVVAVPLKLFLRHGCQAPLKSLNGAPRCVTYGTAETQKSQQKQRLQQRIIVGDTRSMYRTCAHIDGGVWTVGRIRPLAVCRELRSAENSRLCSHRRPSRYTSVNAAYSANFT